MNLRSFRGGDLLPILAVMRKAALLPIAFAVLLSSCTASTPKSAPSLPSSSRPTGTTSPTPTKKSTHVVSARLALYTYQDSIWLYDVKLNKTSQVTRGGTVRMPKWIDASHFSFIQSENTLRIVDLKAGTTTDVFTAPDGIQAYGWSPDGQTVAYITTDASSYPHLRYRSVPDGATQSVATLAPAPGRGGVQSDDIRVQFSKDGSYVLLVYTPSGGGAGVPPEQSQFQVRSSDGTLAFSVDDSRDPTMGLFSRDGRTVYFMDSGGVRAWTAGSGSTRTLRKMQWFNPWASPDGSQIAFDTGYYSTKVRVKVLGLRALTVSTVSKPGRALPVFAGPDALWVQEIVACSGCDGPVKLGAHVFSINTKTLAEKQLPIQSLQDVDVFYQ